MSPHIRAAVLTDLDRLLTLIHGAYRGDSARRGWTHEADLLDGQRTDSEALLEALKSPAERILVAQAGDRLLGCVQVSDRSGGTAYVGLLSVDPEVQALSLGKQLLAAAEQIAAAEFAANRVEMTVICQRSELIAYYQRRGYALTGEERPFPSADPRFGRPRRDDLNFVVMMKTL
jgi:GNAT superfamily N-acetyltransferase